VATRLHAGNESVSNSSSSFSTIGAGELHLIKAVKDKRSLEVQ
jgi:hypothetical protein